MVDDYEVLGVSWWGVLGVSWGCLGPASRGEHGDEGQEQAGHLAGGVQVAVGTKV